MCRQDQEDQERLYKVVMAGYTGLGVSSYFRAAECSKSGLMHSHGLGWKREVDQGEGSLSSLLGRLQAGGGDLTWEERGQVVELGRNAITVTTSVVDLRQQFPRLTLEEAEQVVVLARTVQQHHCSNHCSGSSPDGQTCGQYFPRAPSLLPLVAIRPNLFTDEQKAELEALEKISEKVQELLRLLPALHQGGQEQDPIVSLLSLLGQVAPPPVLQPGGAYFWAGVLFPPSQELEQILQHCWTFAATQDEVLLLAVYHCSLLYRRHAKFVPVRRVSESWGVNYNPWLLLAAGGNVEVELVTHTPQALYSYVTKGATSQTIPSMAEEVESRGGQKMGDMAEQLRLAEEEGWREVCLSEAYIRLDPGLHLITSNCTVTRICVEPLSAIVLLYPLRWAQFMKSLNFHFDRPDLLEYAVALQFVMWYWLAQAGREDDAVQHGPVVPVVTARDSPAPPGQATLPPVIHLTDGRVMRRRRNPVVVEWGPKSGFADIVMLKVPIYLK